MSKIYGLQQHQKLNYSNDFMQVFANKKFFTTNNLKIHYINNKLNHSRLGIIVSKKNHKKATVRNYLKRIVRELFRLNQNYLPNIDIIVRFYYNCELINFNQIKQEFEKFVKKQTKTYR